MAKDEGRLAELVRRAAGELGGAVLAFNLVGDGICVGRDSASAVSPEYQAPFPFTGTVKQVVFDIVPLATADDELAAHLGIGESAVEILGEGPDAAPRVVEVLHPEGANPSRLLISSMSMMPAERLRI